MIVDERLITYINSLNQAENPFLEALEEEARKSYVPIIRKEMKNFLRVLLKMKNPKNILEIGTAIGFSSLFMAEQVSKDCKITTIENYDKRIPIALENFKKAGREEQICLLEGDALMILEELEGSFDFIFLDAAKGQYLSYLPHLLRLLPKGGLLVSDNVLQEGELIESHFIVERRNRTIHKRMREYLYEITHSSQLFTSVIPLGDGVTISIRR